MGHKGEMRLSQLGYGLANPPASEYVVAANTCALLWQINHKIKEVITVIVLSISQSIILFYWDKKLDLEEQ